MKTYYSLSDGVAKNLSFLGFSGIIGLVKNTKIFSTWIFFKLTLIF
jgi:hypothetical protein